MDTDSTSSRSHQVLYVDDEAVNNALMCALFERLPGCELVLADSGAQALERAAGLRPDLLLLDLRLPDMHGSELLQRLRNVPGCEHVPAVAVTAEHGYDISGTGFAELWHKPLNLPSTLERIEQYLACSRLPRQLPLDMPQLTTPTLAVRLSPSP